MEQQSQKVIAEVNKVINGKEDVITKVWTTILAQGHILLEDHPGVGKTTLAKAFSKVLGLQSNRIQFTPDVIASDVIGFTMFDKQQNTFVFKEGAVMCNLLLADEINRTSARTQSALLEAMQEHHITVDGQTYALPTPFIVMATQNPFGALGTYPLPLAQLDRFMVRLSMGYPDFEAQVALLRNRQQQDPMAQIQAVLTQSQVIELQQQVNHLHIHDNILTYVTKLTEATRNHEALTQGISPRGALAICQMAKAHAFVQGRRFVIPEDVQAIWEATIIHRLVYRDILSEQQCKSIIQAILQTIETPDQADITL
ncbi:ATPase [Lysinibacillus alkalisoli]|uniref:ATPase n=1 Tax=Lysinibacillus alkalisoli TaxID=1911548 RepID=A0A917FXG9_9BACI|nr:MoxR family ATPase [Lysinibacillus alkalisoli]GGG12341.1 ATPase [Lysinibacillus alkalisoli]